MAAIIFQLGTVATAIGCCDRPVYIGQTGDGTTRRPSDFDDMFMLVRFTARPVGFVVPADAWLVFDIWAVSSSNNQNLFGVDLKFVGGPWVSDEQLDSVGRNPAELDLTGVDSATAPHWVHVSVPLRSYAGLMVDYAAVITEGNIVGYIVGTQIAVTEIVRIANIAIVTHPGVSPPTALPKDGIVLWLYLNGAPSGDATELYAATSTSHLLTHGVPLDVNYQGTIQGLSLVGSATPVVD